MYVEMCRNMNNFKALKLRSIVKGWVSQSLLDATSFVCSTLKHYEWRSANKASDISPKDGRAYTVRWLIPANKWTLILHSVFSSSNFILNIINITQKIKTASFQFVNV